ncbi:MAG: hypothetical protein AB1633_07570 [Elusimicrobiota bacterium]
MNKCNWHLCGKVLSGRQSKFCSVKCKDKYYVSKKRKSLKFNAVAYKGGKCALCGYNESIEALSFHHFGGKDFGIAFRGYTRSWESVKSELDNCLLFV